MMMVLALDGAMDGRAGRYMSFPQLSRSRRERQRSSDGRLECRRAAIGRRASRFWFSDGRAEVAGDGGKWKRWRFDEVPGECEIANRHQVALAANPATA